MCCDSIMFIKYTAILVIYLTIFKMVGWINFFHKHFIYHISFINILIMYIYIIDDNFY